MSAPEKFTPDHDIVALPATSAEVQTWEPVAATAHLGHLQPEDGILAILPEDAKASAPPARARRESWRR